MIHDVTHTAYYDAYYGLLRVVGTKFSGAMRRLSWFCMAARRWRRRSCPSATCARRTARLQTRDSTVTLTEHGINDSKITM